MDNYDYVMHGRVFKILHTEALNVEVFASFGGLLFKLKGEQVQLNSIVIDMLLYVLIRKSQMHN